MLTAEVVEVAGALAVVEVAWAAAATAVAALVAVV